MSRRRWRTITISSKLASSRCCEAVRHDGPEMPEARLIVRIVAEADRRLSLIRVAEVQVAANLARAQRLRQSILQAAFSG